MLTDCGGTLASVLYPPLGDDGYAQDQVKVFSHEGDGENTEHLKSMDLHDIKTELERDAEKAEVGRFQQQTFYCIC